MHSRLLFLVLIVLACKAEAYAALRICVAELPPISYLGPFGYPQGVLNRLLDNLLASSQVEAERELLPQRDVLRGTLNGDCDAAALVENPYLDEEGLQSWALMDLTLTLVPGIFNRLPAGGLIPAGRYASSRFSSLDEDWSAAIAGFERVNVDSMEDAWDLLQEGSFDGLIGVRENIAWHALNSGAFDVFNDFAVAVGHRKLNFYLSTDVDEDIQAKIEKVLNSLDLRRLVWEMEKRRSF